MTPRDDIPVDTLKQLLECDAQAGTLSWKSRPVEMFPDARAAKVWNTRYAGGPAGSQRHDGYWSVRIFGRGYLKHRIIWAMCHGDWPKEEIDHISTDPSDNSINNLRVATRSLNEANKKLRADNPSGAKGVRKRGRRWAARIRKDGRDIHIGCFDTIDQASAAYAETASALFGEFSRSP